MEKFFTAKSPLCPVKPGALWATNGRYYLHAWQVARTAECNKAHYL